MAWAYWLCHVAPTLYSSLTHDSIYAISLLPTLQYPVQFVIDKKELSLAEWIFWISKWLRPLQKWENLQNTTGFNPYWQFFCYTNIPSWIEFVNFFHPQVLYFGPLITAWRINLCWYNFCSLFYCCSLALQRLKTADDGFRKQLDTKELSHEQRVRDLTSQYELRIAEEQHRVCRTWPGLCPSVTWVSS